MYQYRYHPLPPVAELGVTPPFTRLLLLAPGIAQNPLACSLMIVDIQNAPAFEALSYSWGREPASQPLWCDGWPMPIKMNLDLALRNLRLPNQARRLWVDALCINQADTDERSRQVRYMRLMYKYAARTIVWLGLKTPGLEDVFRLAQMVADIRSASGGAFAHIRETEMGPVERELDLITEILDAHPEVVIHLKNFFNREYFMRIWCVQEVVVSAWCVAKCEDLEIDFMTLLSCIIHVNMRRGAIFVGKPLEFWNMIYMLKKPDRSKLPRISDHVIEGSVGSLVNLLIGTRDFKATDPRDKIFSLFGISDEGLMPVLGLTEVMTSNRDSIQMKMLRCAQRGWTDLAESVNKLGPGIDLGRNKALKPDYSKGVVEVYRDLTRFMMRKSPRVLSVLSHVQHLDEPLSDSFPSWVPKWYQPRLASLLGATGIFLAGLCGGHFRYFALLHDSPLSGPSIRPDVLQIDGYYVDRVVALSAVIDIGVLEVPPVEDLWNQLFGTSFFPLSPHSCRDGDLPQMAFCKTLSAGCLGPAAAAGLQRLDHGGDSPLATFTNQGHADAAIYLMQDQASTSSLSPTQLASLGQAASNGSLARFARSSQTFSYNRRLYVTQKGLIGIGPRIMSEGDEVCVLFGGRVPFILRRMQDHHIFIGETYIHDDNIMWGKLTEGVRRRKQLPTITFDIR
ncbi:MAG: hypothetical protein Q9166_001812 [cf. Caloplaca sp. 2 TL-2023]